MWENAKPRIYTNGSVQLISSNPEILELAGQYSIWIYLRGLKPGAADVSVLPNGKNAKQSNSISFTVVEGEKKLPENLVGTRWVKKSSHYGELSLIFNQSGQFF